MRWFFSGLFLPLAYAMIILMDQLSGLLARQRKFANRISIFNRVLIGNSVIIITAAIIGTFLTRHLTIMGDIWLLSLLVLFVLLVTLLVNYIIIRRALSPLHYLSQALEQVNSGQLKIPENIIAYPDPDIHRLVSVIDSMLKRLAERTHQLQAISERAINAQEEERARIARSLHDDTAQSISMLIIQLERMHKLVPAGQTDLTRKLSEAQNVATLLLENLRKVIWDLRPAILDDLGLLPAIRWFAFSNLDDAGIKLTVSGGNEAIRLPQHLETMLFRITQEMVSNIIRHAEASKVSIRLWPDGEHIWLEIKDDGRGFDVERTAGEAVSRKQLGLLGIQERVSLVGGRLKLDSAPGQGTCLQVCIPLLMEDALNLEENGADSDAFYEKAAQP